MEWVETPEKGTNTSVLLREFEVLTLYVSFGARPDRTRHKSRPAVRQIGGCEGPGASGSLVGD